MGAGGPQRETSEPHTSIPVSCSSRRGSKAVRLRMFKNKAELCPDFWVCVGRGCSGAFWGLKNWFFGGGMWGLCDGPYYSLGF